MPLLAFACISTALGLVLFLSLLLKNPKSPFHSCNPVVTRILQLEMLLEDIPQFILGAMVTHAKGFMTPETVFTLTTSTYNFCLDLSDIIEEGYNEDDSDDGDNGEEVQPELLSVGASA